MSNNLTVPQRFMQKMEAEYSASIGEVKLNEKHKMSLQSYFIGIDNALNAAETSRLNKSKNKDPLPVKWENVNMAELPRKMIHYAKLGLNPLCSNHMFFIPFKNKALNKYDIQIIEGYRGVEIKAMKYGFEVPSVVVVELVRKNDVFKIKKKDANNSIESYTFEINNPFDRGEIVGGFWYKKYDDETKNTLKVFTIADIEKRKPKYASVEFWGGRDKWGNEKEGWVEEMYTKTIARNAYNSITIDADKIDNAFLETRTEEVYEVIEDEVTPIIAIDVEVPEKEPVDNTDQEVAMDISEAVEVEPERDPNVVEGQIGISEEVLKDEDF